MNSEKYLHVDSETFSLSDFISELAFKFLGRLLRKRTKSFSKISSSIQTDFSEKPYSTHTKSNTLFMMPIPSSLIEIRSSFSQRGEIRAKFLTEICTYYEKEIVQKKTSRKFDFSFKTKKKITATSTMYYYYTYQLSCF